MRQLKLNTKKKPKVVILGHARHGKDTVCEMLRDEYGYTFTSSSFFCAEKVVFPKMRERYADATECFDDRANHRAEWYNLIREFNRPDPTRLGRAIFAEYDLYCGLRHHSEFQAMRNAAVFDMAIWIDASDRMPKEPRSSCSVEPWMADYVLDNNGDVADLVENLHSLMTNRINAVF